MEPAHRPSVGRAHTEMNNPGAYAAANNAMMPTTLTVSASAAWRVRPLFAATAARNRQSMGKDHHPLIVRNTKCE